MAGWRHHWTLVERIALGLGGRRVIHTGSHPHIVNFLVSLSQLVLLVIELLFETSHLDLGILLVAKQL